MEGIEMSPELGELAAALAKAQAQIKKAAKNAKNPHLRNKYADLESVLDVVRPVAAEHGLSFPCFPVCRDRTAGVRWMLLHASGQWISGEVLHDVGQAKGLKPAQADGVCISYAKRYAVSAVFAVSTGDDTDGETHAVAKRQNRRQIDIRKSDPAAWNAFATALEEKGIKLEALNAWLAERGKPQAHALESAEWKRMAKWALSDEGREVLT